MNRLSIHFPALSGRTFYFILLMMLLLILPACRLALDHPPTEAPTAAATDPDPASSSLPTEPPPTPVEAAPTTATNTAHLRQAVTVDGMRAHLEALQAIADANNNTRASGTPGYDASADYVKTQLEAAGYAVQVQPFDFLFRHDATELTQTAPTERDLIYFRDFTSMTFTPQTEADGVLQAIRLGDPLRGSSDSGCDAEDFADFVPGNIALIKRGICPFVEKAQNAEAAGASAVLIFNDGADSEREMVVFGTLGEPEAVSIPVVGLSFAAGESLYELTQIEPVHFMVKTALISETRQTANIIAETPGGRDDFVVVVGGHLDSVPRGPGIQDNGSGSAVILEIARQLAALEIEPRNKVRFAFWGAEEFGLLGSQHYVDQLRPAEQDQIALNLNFDMIASPNFGRFVYDGDRSRFSGGRGSPPVPRGSGTIEAIFQAYFADQGLTLNEVPFDGRSDYGPFIAQGIPAGGLFTGAEGLRPAGQAPAAGSPSAGDSPGRAYDPCYHQPCDTLENINWQALDEMSDAAAHAVLIFAMTDQSVAETTAE